MFRKLFRQVDYAIQYGSEASRLRKFLLGLRYDCYVSGASNVFYPGKIRLAFGVRIYPKSMINVNSGYSNHEYSLEIGEDTKIMPYVQLVPQQGYIRLGKNCTVQYGSLLYGVGGLEIGDNTRIAAQTVITPMNHIFSDPNTPIWKQGETAEGIRIGNDVWIANNVCILDGVEIGDGSVIGAGSVVTRDIPPYSVAVGTPAVVIRKRG